MHSGTRLHLGPSEPNGAQEKHQTCQSSSLSGSFITSLSTFTIDFLYTWGGLS